MVKYRATIVGKFEQQQAKKPQRAFYEALPIMNNVMEPAIGVRLVANEECYGKGSVPQKDAM